MENEVEFRSIVMNENNLCGLAIDGRAFCMGSNSHDKLGVPFYREQAFPKFRAVAPTLRFSQLVLGLDHLCGVTREGAAYCWGFGRAGQLGDGAGSSQGTPIPVANP